MRKLLSFALAALIITASFISVNAKEYEPNNEVPRFIITTQDSNGLNLQKEDGYVNAKIEIVDTDNTTIEEDVTLKVRGHSTALPSIKKKAFNFKFSKKKDLFGMGKGKKWSLLANFYDPTLMRNFLSFDLARKLGLEFTSNCRMVELWLDGSFRGCYILLEPVQEGSDRVDINIENEKDFMLELEMSRNDSDVTYIKAGSMRFGISEPETPDETEVNYIQNIMNSVVKALKTHDRAEIEKVMDTGSFEKFYIFNEFVKPPDLNFSSVYFYYKDGKLFAGPPWDYDISFGNSNIDFSKKTYLVSEPEHNYANGCNMFTDLTKCDWFMSDCAKLFGDNLSLFTDIYSDGGMIETYLSDYADMITRNCEVWDPSTFRVNVMRRPFKTYKENVVFLRNWCKARAEYMTDYLAPYYPKEASDDEASVYSYFVKGDVNLDTRLNIKDSTAIQKALADMESFPVTHRYLADFNSDNKINIKDATAIQKALVNIQ